ncbi:uncharacterized protein [Mytilus edulis]|uniref:uncharacterized protein n=1 Tax=Mytilus edulis TaxID=6550 RepID=UPI0039EF7880
MEFEFLLVLLLLLTKSLLTETKLTKEQPLIIKDSGVTNTKIGSIALVVYVDVKNPRPSAVDVEILVEKCCIDEGKKDDDCEIMKVYGGYIGPIKARETKTTTFIYPTHYPHDMAGMCILFLKADNFTQILQIVFNTTLEYEKPVSFLPEFVNEYLFDVRIPHKCPSPDEDRFHHCSPVMCDMKYHGHRNYFNETSRLCSPLPDCPGSNIIPPAMVFDIESNSCKNVARPKFMTKEEKKLLSGKHDYHADYEEVDWMTERRMACNHGILLPNKSSCLCNPGWDSLVLPDQEIHNRRLQMCNKGRKGYWKHVLVGVALSVTIIVLLHVSNHKRRKDKQKRYRELSPDISPVKAGFFQSLHDDYNPKGAKNKNVLTIDIDFEDDSFEMYKIEKRGRISQFFHRIYHRLIPAKKDNIDFSMEEINVGTTLLSPVSMDADYEFD